MDEEENSTKTKKKAKADMDFPDTPIDHLSEIGQLTLLKAQNQIAAAEVLSHDEI